MIIEKLLNNNRFCFYFFPFNLAVVYLSVCDQFCSCSRLVTQVSDEASHKLTNVNTAGSLIFGH